MNLVDDATASTLGRLGAQETIWAAAGVLRRWIEKYGVPLELYTDWKNVYVREATEKEMLRGEVPVTQFGRMCERLEIRIIAANSPQAKGRDLPEHNRRFARAAVSAEDYQRKKPSATELDEVFRLETERAIGNDWVVRHQNRLLQVMRQSRYAPAKGKVVVCEWEDAKVEIGYRGERLIHEEIATRPAEGIKHFV